MVHRNGYQTCVSLLAAFACLLFVILFANIGGLLNRGRGGWVNFGPPPKNHSQPDPSLGLPYWPAHVLSRLLFAIPTGLVVLLCGLHVRASVIVTILTWFSLYVGWGSYMNVGTNPNDYDSRSGVFDWLVGRQVESANWTLTHRVVREYSAMSLRGLVWTAPQGYALQQLGFGWEYSLSGSLMAAVYYGAHHTPSPSDPKVHNVFSTGLPYAEYFWGWWLWFVLIISCLSQLVRRIHVWIYRRNQYLDFKPYSISETMKYESLNRCLTHSAYELLMIGFNLLLGCSLVYYSLVTQSDIKNKGMTFFGLFTGALFLTFVQGWVWNIIYLRWLLRKAAKVAQRRQYRPSNGNRQITRTATPRISNLDQLEASGETQPLLSWPNERPESRAERQAHANQGNRETVAEAHVQLLPATGSSACLILWPSIEKWVWVDVFVWVRRLVGLISAASTLFTLVLTVVATVWDWHTPRFDPYPL